ncbi:MAG: Holliday junction resolvase RuvX [Bacilli bacterium]
MKVLGLDVGTVTVGVAISDAFGWTAQGIETIRIDASAGDDGFDRIKELVDANEVSSFVVGLPKNMNGSIGERGQACQAYAARLEERFGLPVVLWDERLTTMAAERMLVEADVSRKKRKKVVDKMAAALILQGYLDSKSN